MANRRAFKTDESFLEKISIGALGTKKVFEDLVHQGHMPIELERCSMSFKIWKTIKIKRVRVPDILCVKCATRIESRAKQKLEITMSHSFSSPERGWDFGLSDKDYIAFVKCERAGETPVAWEPSDLVQYIAVGSMRGLFKKNQVISEKPKGATEGFEARITWPTSIAGASGKITYLSDDRIQYKRIADSRTISLSLTKRGLKMASQVELGTEIRENQIIASVVPVNLTIPCKQDKDADYYLNLLHSSSLCDRYSAAKALSYFDSTKVKAELAKKMKDEADHIYIRLEAAASLLKLGDKESESFIEQILADDYLENRLEAIIILAEINQSVSTKILIQTLLDKKQHPEIRAGAAWSLGEQKTKNALSALTKVFNEVDLNIRAEASRALMKIGDKYSKDIISYFPGSDENTRAGIAWALSKSGQFALDDLLSVVSDEEARKWTAWIIGTQNEKKYINEVEKIKTKDKEVYFAVTVLWKILSSWIEGLEIY